MGKGWDHGVPSTEFWAEALRVLKPGGHLLAFGGTRTFHRLAVAIEDAGFEIRDTLSWMYGSGFPKSMDVSKAIDKAARGVPHGGADPTSPNHGKFKTQRTEGKRGKSDRGRGFGAGPGQFMQGTSSKRKKIGNTGLRVGDIDPYTGKRIAGIKPGHEEFVSRPDNMKALREGTHSQEGGFARPWMKDKAALISQHLVFASETEQAEQWKGWGTALKPSWEPIVMARKPLREKTVAANVLAHGTGALNIDATRIGENPGYKYNANRNGTTFHGEQGARIKQSAEKKGSDVIASTQGRWPANTLLSHDEGCEQVGTKTVKGGRPIRVSEERKDRGTKYDSNAYAGRKDKSTSLKPGSRSLGAADTIEEVWECVEGCPVRLLDEQSGTRKPSGVYSGDGSRLSDGKGVTSFEQEEDRHRPNAMYADKGGASRFFYSSKTSKKERNAGLPDGKKNDHPTVKPVAVMRWLVKLVTPPGGVVLDPFMGSGTTGVAAIQEGFSFVGIDKEAEYVEIARHRICHAIKEKRSSR